MTNLFPVFRRLSIKRSPVTPEASWRLGFMAAYCLLLGYQMLGFAWGMADNGRIDLAQFDSLVHYFGGASLVMISAFLSLMFVVEFLHNCQTSVESPIWAVFNQPRIAVLAGPVRPDVVPI